MNRRLQRRCFVGLVLCGVLVLGQGSERARAQDTLHIYVCPIGCDLYDGLSRWYPVQTLSRVATVMNENWTNQTSVEIHVSPGDYVSQVATLAADARGPIRISLWSDPGPDEAAQWGGKEALHVTGTRASLSSAPPLRIYMAPDGDDDNDGLTEESPVNSLWKVEDILDDPEGPDLSDNPQHVEVCIAPGRYFVDQSERNQARTDNRWTLTMPEHKIWFRCWPEDSWPENPPVFDGGCPDEHYRWFLIHPDPEYDDPGQRTNLVFWHLRVENYQNGLYLGHTSGWNFHQDPPGTICDPPGRGCGWNGNNVVYGCVFHQIGNEPTNDCPTVNPSDTWGAGAIGLVHSHDNLVMNNRFVHLVNYSDPESPWVDYCSHLHGVYMAHDSDRNMISSNWFEEICGDPVKVRDGCDFNRICSNYFLQTGIYAAFMDAPVDDAPGIDPRECFSWENRVYDNTLEGEWDCDQLWAYYLWPAITGPDCPDPPFTGAERIRTWDNVSIPEPDCGGS